jgi:hypothetical protein
MKTFIVMFMFLVASVCWADTIDGVTFEPVEVTKTVKDGTVNFILKSLVANNGKKGTISLTLICTGTFDYVPIRKRLDGVFEENETKELSTSITITTHNTQKYDNAHWEVEHAYKIE